MRKWSRDVASGSLDGRMQRHEEAGGLPPVSAHPTTAIRPSPPSRTVVDRFSSVPPILPYDPDDDDQLPTTVMVLPEEIMYQYAARSRSPLPTSLPQGAPSSDRPRTSEKGPPRSTVRQALGGAQAGAMRPSWEPLPVRRPPVVPRYREATQALPSSTGPSRGHEAEPRSCRHPLEQAQSAANRWEADRCGSALAGGFRPTGCPLPNGLPAPSDDCLIADDPTSAYTLEPEVVRVEPHPARNAQRDAAVVGGAIIDWLPSIPVIHSGTEQDLLEDRELFVRAVPSWRWRWHWHSRRRGLGMVYLLIGALAIVVVLAAVARASRPHPHPTNVVVPDSGAKSGLW